MTGVLFFALEMSLSQLSTGDIGFVSGIVDLPITEQQRAEGVVGHTAEEWESYNHPESGATQHVLRDEHDEVVGHLLHTYVDRQGRLCASGMLDMQNPKNKDLFARVKSGEKHSFSIGYDALPQKGTRRYKNASMDVSLTTDPRKEFAVVQVRCSNKMSSSEGENQGTAPAPEPMETTSEPAASNQQKAGGGGSKATQEAPKETTTTPPPNLGNPQAEEAVKQLQARLAAAEEAAKRWKEHEAAEKKKLMETNLEMLKASSGYLSRHGFDMEEDTQKPVAQALAQSDRSTKLLSAVNGMSKENSTLSEENAALKRKIEEFEAQQAASRRNEQQSNGLMDILRQLGGSADQPGKRVQTTPGSMSTKLSDTEADILGLGSIDTSLFQKAAQAASASEKKSATQQNEELRQQLASAVAASSSSSTPPESDEPEMVEMPTDPKGRLDLAFKLLQYPGAQMPQLVRCSKGQPGFRRGDIENVLRTRPTAFGECVMSDATIQLLFSDDKHWQTRADKLEPNAWSRNANGETRDYSHLKPSTVGPSPLWSVGVPH